MDADRWARVAQLYQTALERPPNEREAFLAAACAEDEDLRREVESLLAQAEKPVLLDAPVWQAAARVLDDNPAVQPRTRIGPYEVLALIGEGGMGQVYRARDTSLGRDVALKVLPAAFSSDVDRLARFRREAQVLASLNHPHIATIHGFETSGSIHALVLELVEGPTLADRIAQGRIPFDEALAIARQIAEALEAAHERGIVHRDLKPANIKLREDGTVKVLDFGLAKALDSEVASSGDAQSRLAVTASPTVMSPAVTAAGVILGTTAYMAPEQAKGKLADKRSDIWAFGCVLYEMLTGKRAFEGDDVSDTLAAVLRGTPDWSALPSSVPPSLLPIVTTCLEKDRRERLADASALRFLIRQAAGAAAMPTSVQTAGRWSRASIVGALVAVIVVVAALSMWAGSGRPSEPRLRPMRFAVQPEGVATIDSGPQLALSADGNLLVYSALRQGVERIFVRPMDRLESTPIRAMLGSSIAPFLSPDGKWVGFFPLARGDLSKVPAGDGMAIVICQITGRPRGAAWRADNTIIFATDDPEAGLLTVSADGGAVDALTTPDRARGEVDHLFPSTLPGDAAVLFTVVTPGAPHSWQIDALDLKTRTRKVVIRGASYARYSASGHLLYASAGKLHAVRFDPIRLEVDGEPVLVENAIEMSPTGAAQFTVSDSGMLAYVPALTDAGSIRRLLTWADRRGRETLIPAPPQAYTYARLTPDQTRVALDVRDANNDIWIWHLSRETLTRLTFHSANDIQPVWTPEGQRILFGSNRGGTMDLFAQRSDGSASAERVTTSGTALQPQAISPDGRFVVVLDQSNTENSLSLVTLNDVARVQPLLQRATIPDISPDGRWLAYQSSESGRPEVHVRPFPDVSAGQWQVSVGGGRWPKWAASGRELFYVVGETLMSAQVQLAPTFRAGKPLKLFESPGLRAFAQARTYDVTRDGQKFLMITEADTPERMSPAIVVVANWTEELQQRVPTR